MIPYLMSLVKSTSKSERMKGRRRVKEGFLSLETIMTHNAFCRAKGVELNLRKVFLMFCAGLFVAYRPTVLIV